MKDKNKKTEEIEFKIPLNKKTFWYAAIIFALAALVYTIVITPHKIGTFITSMLALLSPFIIGLCLAYIVNLLLRPIERFWLYIWRKAKKQKVVSSLKRPICLVVSYLAVVGALFAIVFMVIPAFKEAAINFVDKVPQYVVNIENWYYSASDFFDHYNFDLPKISVDSAKVSDICKNIIAKYGNSVISTTITVTTSILGAVVDIVLGIVFSVYLIFQKETLARQIKKILNALLKREKTDKILYVANITNNAFTKFITGQLVEACIIGLLCFIGMRIFGMPYASIVSLLVGFTAIIPIFGAFIGTGIGAFLILLESPVKAFWFIVFIIVLQQIEGNLIYPRVVGKTVGLPGIWVLAAVTIGAGLFKLMGMLFSVPICSVLYALFREYVNKKTDENKPIEQEELATDD